MRIWTAVYFIVLNQCHNNKACDHSAKEQFWNWKFNFLLFDFVVTLLIDNQLVKNYKNKASYKLIKFF